MKNMDNNTDELNTVTTKNVSKYLKEKFTIKNSVELFTDIKKNNEQSYFNIINKTFKEFAKHQIDETGQLRADDPDDLLFSCYVFGYPGYFRIESLEDLVADMRQAILLRNQHLKPYKQNIGLEQTENKSKYQERIDGLDQNHSALSHENDIEI